MIFIHAQVLGYVPPADAEKGANVDDVVSNSRPATGAGASTTGKVQRSLEAVKAKVLSDFDAVEETVGQARALHARPLNAVEMMTAEEYAAKLQQWQDLNWQVHVKVFSFNDVNVSSRQDSRQDSRASTRSIDHSGKLSNRLTSLLWMLRNITENRLTFANVQIGLSRLH